MGNQKETAVRLLSENFTAVMEARSAWRAAVQQMFRDGEPVYLWGTGQMGQWAAHLVRDMGPRGHEHSACAGYAGFLFEQSV